MNFIKNFGSLKISTKYFIGGVLTYIIPILILGDIRKTYVLGTFIVSLPVIYYLIHKQFKRKLLQGNSKLSFIAFLSISIFLSLMGLSPFEGNINKGIITIGIKYANVFGYWLSYTSTTLLFERYLKYKNLEKMAEFENDVVKMERDNKIDKILSKF
jgi:hypothetical protein